MTQLAITDHETMWRDNGESFTFRTRAAPGKGGDAGAFNYARLMQDKLGFVYGPYNNFTDFAPVNEFWSADLVSRTPDNQLAHAWMRCYAPKPARAVEFCERLAPEIQRKFRFSTAYCDVHTAVAPWHRVDYDPRVPGAGTFAAVFYSYGEIMLHQKRAWNGPVYSEGNYHAFYCGLTDGNYGQDQSYRPADNPWLVDFDLRRLHDLCCNFGMGNPDMFYASQPQPQSTREQREAWLDRFLAATVAFGHPGFLVFEGGKENAMRSYYMLQQLHSRYCLTNATDIRYANAAGALLPTSLAVAAGAHARSQVVTRYSDGTITAANGSRTERLRAAAPDGRLLDLPPNGYAGWTTDGAIEVLSSDSRGHRGDYAVTPAYLFVDGRGRFMRFPKAGGNGLGVCRILGQGRHEVILRQQAECGFAVPAAQAVALDPEGKELGPASLRRARGLTYVQPVKGAFSYRLDDDRAAGVSTPGEEIVLTCERDEVVAGERLVVRGKQSHDARIPSDAQPGQRVWLQFEGAWIDFTVLPLADTTIGLEDNTLVVQLTSHLGETMPFRVRLSPAEGGLGRAREQQVPSEPGKPVRVRFDLGTPALETAEVLGIELQAGELSQQTRTALLAASGHRSLTSMPSIQSRGIGLRGGQETAEFGQSGALAEPRMIRCGEQERSGFFMHPPYQGGVGYAFVVFEPVALPPAQPAAFRAWVGKAEGSDPGDGILFKVIVIEETGVETIAAQVHAARHEWLPLDADLSRWAGRTVRLKVLTDVGPRNDSTGDWAGCAGWRLETLQPVLVRSLDPSWQKHRREQGPFPLPDLTLPAIRAARRGWLHYDGKGLEGPGRYGTVAVLNGIDLGAMSPAHGDETQGKYAEKVRIPLTPEALRSLQPLNRLVVKNPQRDCFSLRRFWLELELPDGRRASSDIAAATFSQPPDWLHAEGEKVPFGRDIAVNVVFPIK
jgi:hypothetical protein